MRPCPIDWSVVLEDAAGKKCLRYGTIVTRIEDSHGMYGPFQRSATDGRQRLVRSESFIINETICESYVDVKGFETGDVYMANLLTDGGENPTLDEFHEAFKLTRPLSD